MPYKTPPKAHVRNLRTWNIFSLVNTLRGCCAIAEADTTIFWVLVLSLLWCAELLVPHTVAKHVQSIFCGKAAHEQIVIRLQLPTFISEQPSLCRELPWFGPALLLSVLQRVGVLHYNHSVRIFSLSFSLRCPNGLPQFSSRPLQLQCPPTASVAWSEEVFPLILGLWYSFQMTIVFWWLFLIAVLTRGGDHRNGVCCLLLHFFLKRIQKMQMV